MLVCHMQVLLCAKLSVVQVVVSSRSSINERLLSLRGQVKCIAERCGASVDENEIYSGWSPDPESALIQLTKHVYMDKFSIEPKVTALHAGLEVCVALFENVLQGLCLSLHTRCVHL
jgi:dipeptidase D